MSGRLEEMPGEEGYPPTLASRLAQFYERAGCVDLHRVATAARGALSAIGAVSPSGRRHLRAGFARRTLRIVKVFWSLTPSLAYTAPLPRHQLADQLFAVRSTTIEQLVRRAMSRRDWTRPATSGRCSCSRRRPSCRRSSSLVGMDALSAGRPPHAGDCHDRSARTSCTRTPSIDDGHLFHAT
ncbi:MAG: hypothetical protein ACLTSG_12820 [Lachnospiraceae bacterium]